MTRTWQELFVTGEDVPPPAEPDGEPERRGFLRRLRENMSKTRQALGAELQATVFQSLDDEAFERLEEALIYADVGAPTTAAFVVRLERDCFHHLRESLGIVLGPRAVSLRQGP